MVHLHRIVCGGQTGVDRAALDFAAAAGIDYGGWVPKGRLDEDGTIPQRYKNLVEAASEEPAIRTRLNVRDSDGTVLISFGSLKGGSRLTAEIAIEIGKPMLHIDLERMSQQDAARLLQDWIIGNGIHTLNVAGPRASEEPAIYAAARSVLGLAAG